MSHKTLAITILAALIVSFSLIALIDLSISYEQDNESGSL